MIWTISNFYNKIEPLTGLLRKISNQIIIQCSQKITLVAILDGDVEQSLAHLQESIQCGLAWRRIFEVCGGVLGGGLVVGVLKNYTCCNIGWGC